MHGCKEIDLLQLSDLILLRDCIPLHLRFILTKDHSYSHTWFDRYIGVT